MDNESPITNTWTYRAREVVGTFANPDALEEAVNQLETSGFNRANISVLGTDKDVRERIGHLYRTAAEAEDDPAAPQTAFQPKGAHIEEEAAAVAFPLYIGGVAGAVAVVASGGALAAAVIATLAGSMVGAGIGGLLAYSVARHHTAEIKERLAQGGLVLWVAVPDSESEKRALATLKDAGARHVHVHEVQREWGPRDRPLAEAHLDPLLERDNHTS